MRKQTLLAIFLMLFASVLLVACGGAAPAATEAPAEEEPMEEEAPAEEEPMEEEAPAEEEPMEEEAPAAEKTVIDFWSFTNELMTMAIAYEGVNPDVDIVYTMAPMDAGEYQTKLKSALGTDEAPDIMALEASFVREYVESDILMTINDLLPAAEAAGTYQYVLDVATDFDGNLKALSWQATPGAVFYRRSIAKEYFGTDDPDEIQAMMSDMDGFTEMAATLKDAGGGDVYMVASNREFENPYWANRSQPWVVDDTFVIDPKMDEYVELSKMFRDEGYEAQAGQWSEGWFAGMSDTLVDAEGNSKQIFCYFLPTWGLPYVLKPNATTEDGSGDTAGDWGIVPGPLPYSWGGTFAGVLAESDNADLAKEIVTWMTTDETHLSNWALGVYDNAYLAAIDPSVPEDQGQAAGDFVSSQVVVEKIVGEFDGGDLAEFLAGQNSYAGFAAAAPAVSGALLQGSDDAIQRAFADPMNQFLAGEISQEELYEVWKDSIRIEFPDLIVP